MHVHETLLSLKTSVFKEMVALKVKHANSTCIYALPIALHTHTHENIDLIEGIIERKKLN